MSEKKEVAEQPPKKRGCCSCLVLVLLLAFPLLFVYMYVARPGFESEVRAMSREWFDWEPPAVSDDLRQQALDATEAGKEKAKEYSQMAREKIDEFTRVAVDKLDEYLEEQRRKAQEKEQEEKEQSVADESSYGEEPAAPASEPEASSPKPPEQVERSAPIEKPATVERSKPAPAVKREELPGYVLEKPDYDTIQSDMNLPFLNGGAKVYDSPSQAPDSAVLYRDKLSGTCVDIRYLPKSYRSRLVKNPDGYLRVRKK